MQRIPFTIEAWKAGGVPVTRSGEYVKQLTYFEGADTNYPFIGIIDNKIDSWERSGSYTVEEQAKDLFLEVPCTKYYTHYYKDLHGNINSVTTKDKLLKLVDTFETHIKTVEVEL